MPYVFNQISTALKGKDKDKFKPATGGEAASSSVEAPSQSSGATGQGKTESPDTPRMKDYITKNTMSYDTTPVAEVYQAASKRAGEQSKEIESKEREAFKTGVEDVTKQAWSAPALPTRPETPDRGTTGTYMTPEPRFDAQGGLIRERPTAVDEEAYASAAARLQDYANKVRGGYIAGVETVAAPQTEQAKDLLTTRLGRRGLLTRKYEEETPHYTEGMQTLDAALAERSGIDTRQAGQMYKGVASDVDAARQRLESIRAGLQSDRDTRALSAEVEVSQVNRDLQAAREQYANLDQQYEQEMSAYEEKQRQDEIARKEAEEAERQRQRDEAIAAKEQAAKDAETKLQEDYNNYIVQAQADVISRAKDQYEKAVAAKRDVARQAAEADIASFYTMLQVSNPSSAFNGNSYTAKLDQIAKTYGVRVNKSELPAILKKYANKYGGYDGIYANRAAIANETKQLTGQWNSIPNPDIQKYYPSTPTYDSYDTWKARNGY